jgi:hypothetical protein
MSWQYRGRLLPKSSIQLIRSLSPYQRRLPSDIDYSAHPIVEAAYGFATVFVWGAAISGRLSLSEAAKGFRRSVVLLARCAGCRLAFEPLDQLLLVYSVLGY